MELEEAMGMDKPVAAKLIRPTLLALDTVEMILAGEESSRLSLTRLMKASSMIWDAQRPRQGVAFPA